MRPLQKFTVFQDVYDRLALEVEGWADLDEEARLDLVELELLAN